LTISAAIATYGREEVLLATVEQLLALARPPDEIVVVDQSAAHEPETARRLAGWHEHGRIRWRRRATPSIPAALNEALLAARGELVLVLDDDVELAGEIVQAHEQAHEQAHAAGATAIVAGQVLQPGERPAELAGRRFEFRSSVAQEIDEFMGGNFSVRRDWAIGLGGFDENFVGAAYRFESDFAMRARRAGVGIRFEPRAAIRHLRAARGGTRSYGHHLRTVRPVHSVGEYYHLLVNRPPAALRRAVHRFASAAWTRHHLRRPWWIPATLAAEALGAVWAGRLALGGRKLIGASGPIGTARR
jgi:GT2 family glycosyltransferase